ncbi:MAG: hypothetical protein ISS25_00065 [Nanoarchaeota archaeon]|nr:hypothetical protein [DPANN group archaeon]MBL7116213.1 hypothetical protein [Nanoarchaeota archaeon]
MAKKSSRGDGKQDKIFGLLGALLILFALYNVFQISSFSNLFDEKIAEAKEAARPAELQMIVITDSDCTDCFDIQSVVDSVKNAHVNITSEKSVELSSDEAQGLISKYSIEKIPTVLLFGETNKTVIRNMEKTDDALVFRALTPPYVDADTSSVMGRVSAVILEDSSCDKCYNMAQILQNFKQSGITVVSERVVDRNSEEGQSLISKYSFESLPALILSRDLEAYGGDIIAGWRSFGSVEEDAYVTRLTTPPYVDLNEDRVVGLISMTFLVDGSCDECYDATNLHKSILARMGVVVGEEKIVDVSSSDGQALVDKYSITKVPTIILEGDVDKYLSVVNAWRSVGTVESDGTYVFRQVEFAAQKYKDLTTGEVVQP